MLYIKTEGNKILSFHCGQKLPRNCIEVPESFSNKYDDIRFYTEEWEEKGILQLISENLLQIPEGYRYSKEDNCFIEGDGDQLHFKTLEDSLLLKEITQAEYNNLKDKENAESRKHMYSALDTQTMRKLRKTACGTWTESDEKEYTSLCKKTTKKAEQMYPKNTKKQFKTLKNMENSQTP